ncbi:hypothetical protein JCM10049v2_000978 [Rhodotorula toruloides]
MPADLDNFLDPVPQALCCPVCQDVAWQPVIACENQHILCEECLMNVIDSPDAHPEEPPACPTCRAVADEDYEVSIVGKRILEGLRYRCSRHAAGCEWVGSVGDECDHRLHSCDYRELSCFSCGMKSLAKDGLSHTSTCPNGLVACPNGDNDICGKIYRSNVEHHMTVCTRFRCRNFAFCGAQSTRANLEEHQPRCTSLISRLDAVEKDAASLRAQLASRPPRPPSPPRPPKPQDKPLVTSLDPPGMSKTHLLLIRLDEGSFVADLDKETVKKVSAPVGGGRPLRSRSPPPQRQGGDDRWAVPLPRGGQGAGGGGGGGAGGGKRSRFDSPPRRGRTWGRGG